MRQTHKTHSAYFDQSGLRVIWFRWKNGDLLVVMFRAFPFPAGDTDVLPFGRLWSGDTSAVANAIGYGQHCSRSVHAVIRVYDEAGNVIETHEHAGEFKE